MATFDRELLLSAHLALGRFGHAAVLACGIDLEAVGFRGVMALVSGAGDNAGERRANLRLAIAGMTVASVWPS